MGGGGGSLIIQQWIGKGNGLRLCSDKGRWKSPSREGCFSTQRKRGAKMQLFAKFDAEAHFHDGLKTPRVCESTEKCRKI